MMSEVTSPPESIYSLPCTLIPKSTVLHTSTQGSDVKRHNRMRKPDTFVDRAPRLQALAATLA